MFIKQIVIDGFKSYAQRTEVGPFDPQFNAITGLNGSGKSNILDSICFLLGISNLSQVRAGSLQELVYKGGQAGITKATVTITFDNSDKKQSPVGYESFDELTVSRQVIIGGRNKYLINGSNAPPSRVQDLFRSVQLNVNNPHFLIMQGRITKVLNMKPPEILSMIEEAAGTRMYESKRSSAQKTIEKKDLKLSEIEEILANEITPTLKKLKDERSSYLEYQKVTRELEHLSRLLIAYNFTKAEDHKQQLSVDLEQARQTITDLKAKTVEINSKIAEKEQTIKQLYQQRKTDNTDGPLQELERKVEKLSKAVGLAEATLKDSQHQLSGEKKNYKELVKLLEEDQELLLKRKNEISKYQDTYLTMQQKLNNTQKNVLAAQKHLQAVLSGFTSSTNGQNDTLATQKIIKENEISNAQTSIKQSEMKLENLTNELTEKEKTTHTSEKTYLNDKAAHEKLKKEIIKLEKSLAILDYREGQLEEMKEKRDDLRTEIAGVKAKMDGLESKFSSLQFQYVDPYTGFDRSSVKGPVAKLLKVNDISSSTALEVTAGGKLYHVIVNTEETGKELLQNGQLKRRYTIIPLNKIVGKKIANDIVKKAQDLVGDDKARPALSLISYEEDLHSAMEYVFGTTFICHTLHDAKQVTFNQRIKTRSVSLAGDVFDPSGTLTGGSRPQIASVLLNLQEYWDMLDFLKKKEKEVEQSAAIIQELEQTSHRYAQLKEELDGKKHEVEVICARMELSAHHQHLLKVRELKESISTLNENLKQTKDFETKAKCELKEIEYKLENSKGIHDQELKEAEKRLEIAKKEAEKAAEDARDNNQGMDGLQLEVSELESSISAQIKQIECSSKTIEEWTSKITENTANLDETKEKMTEAMNELTNYKAVLKEQYQELQQQEKELKELEADKMKCGLEVKENEHKVSCCLRDGKEADKKLDVLLNKYEWISVDKQYFGLPNTAYDFKAVEPREAEKRSSKLQERKDKLSRNVNMRAMNMLGKAEEKYNDLMKKKKIVENDKAKIAELINELDQKKNEALQSAWKRVNQDFGSIFSTLLPGSSAKLCPPQGMSVLEGLEVKVAFGDVWKESLSELSGGQRSLVALSLILSLLLFKPAPLYILDEVDAALDLSHTQNIGQMLRSHFHHSQFIVVSLKNGMFDNANVLFKTKFTDGVSTVTRYVNPKIQQSKELKAQKSTSRRL